MYSLSQPGRLVMIMGAMLMLALVQGCASIVSGQDQIVSVNAPQCPAASCKLQNEEGSFYIPTTPGTVMVNREYGDLVVTCSKPGFPDFMMTVKSTTKGMAYGNIQAGGIIGAAVDAGTGAAYDYPSEIIVAMDCRSPQEISNASLTGSFGIPASKFASDAQCTDAKLKSTNGSDELYEAACPGGVSMEISCNTGGCLRADVAGAAKDAPVAQ